MVSLMTHYSLEPANHSDYRDFLKARFEFLKRANKNFSLQNCATKSKISKSLLQFLFRKKRHISIDKLPNLAKTLKLNQEEEAFVYMMICKDSSQNSVIRSHFESILSKLRHEHIKTDLSVPEIAGELDKYFFENYLLIVLQTLTRLVGFKEDPQWILENLKIHGLTEKQVVAGLKELEESGYIFRDENLRLRPHEKSFWRPDPYDTTAYRVYTRSAEAVAKLMQHPQYCPSVYSTLSVCMDEERLLAAEKYMIETHHHLSALAKASTEPTAMIYFGNFMMTLARLK